MFSAWDEQYETLQGTLRDIAKKKREEPLKVSWRVNPAHKLLQTRIDQMRKFRRQHEQLRWVLKNLKPLQNIFLTDYKDNKSSFYFSQQLLSVFCDGDLALKVQNSDLKF